jgi:hypothetical protein
MKRALLIALSLVLIVGAEFLTRHLSLRQTYRYYETSEVYLENQHTLLLYLPHRHLFWTLRPGVRLNLAENISGYALAGSLPSQEHEWSVEVNSLGFRGRETPASKPSGVFRVGCFGDSRTLGEGLTESETWPRQLEKMLRLRLGETEVLNLAADGWSSHQGLELLKRSGSLSLAAAVFCFGINDADGFEGISDLDRSNLMDSPMVTLQRSIYSSFIVTALQRRAHQAVAWAWKPTRLAPFNGLPDRPRVTPGEFRENILSFSNVCQERGILPIFLILPVNPFYDWSPWIREGAEPSVSYRAARRLRDAGRYDDAAKAFLDLRERAVFALYGRTARRTAAEIGNEAVDVSDLADPDGSSLNYS